MSGWSREYILFVIRGNAISLVTKCMRAHTRDSRVCFGASQQNNKPHFLSLSLRLVQRQERHRITSHTGATFTAQPAIFRLGSEQLAFSSLIYISCIPLRVFILGRREQKNHILPPATMQGNGRSQDEEPYIRQSRLLQLPKELQLSIWEFALAEHDPIPFFATDETQIKDHPRSSINRRLKWYIPPLLQTCRTFRIEGLPVFYSSNIFILQHGPIFDDYQHAHTLFRRYWHHLTLITDFGIEYKLPSSNTFLLRGQRRLIDDGYTFDFSSDAAPSHQRPLTALEASETDSCLCMIKAMVKKRLYATVCDFTDAMIAFLAAFGEKMTKNELRVLRFCGDCGKKMVEQKPRRPRWEDLPPVLMPMHSSLESMVSD
jgi:hypothetical protein